MGANDKTDEQKLSKGPSSDIPKYTIALKEINSRNHTPT